MSPEQFPSRPAVRRDLAARVQIGEVFGGYFNSSEKTVAFCYSGLSAIVPALPRHPVVADFGGGDGHLAAGIREYLVGQGKSPRVIVVDGNPKYLQKAQAKGLETVQADITAVTTSGLDLVVSRAAFHYNSLAGQREILDRVREGLNPAGYFVNQISSGDAYNTALRGAISALPSLGRASKGDIHFVTPDEYLAMTTDAGFTTEFVGYAPPNSWTPEEMFDRFHPPIPYQVEDSSTRQVFLGECMELIRRYKETTPIEGVTLTGESARVEYQYPIFVSKVAA